MDQHLIFNTSFILAVITHTWNLGISIETNLTLARHVLTENAHIHV